MIAPESASAECLLAQLAVGLRQLALGLHVADGLVRLVGGLLGGGLGLVEESHAASSITMRRAGPAATRRGAISRSIGYASGSVSSSRAASSEIADSRRAVRCRVGRRVVGREPGPTTCASAVDDRRRGRSRPCSRSTCGAPSGGISTSRQVTGSALDRLEVAAQRGRAAPRRGRRPRAARSGRIAPSCAERAQRLALAASPRAARRGPRSARRRPAA